MNMMINENLPMNTPNVLTFDDVVNLPGIRVRFHNVEEAYPLFLEYLKTNEYVQQLLASGLTSLTVMAMVQNKSIYLAFFNTESRLNFNYLVNRSRFLASEGIYLFQVDQTDEGPPCFSVLKHGQALAVNAVVTELVAEPFHLEQGRLDERFLALSVLVISK